MRGKEMTSCLSLGSRGSPSSLGWGWGGGPHQPGYTFSLLTRPALKPLKDPAQSLPQTHTHLGRHSLCPAQAPCTWKEVSGKAGREGQPARWGSSRW